MGTITDADGNEVDLDQLLGQTEIIRCKNWEREPDICGETCGIQVPLAAVMGGGNWITMVLDQAPEWFVMLRSCSEHGRHADPYCSLDCFTRYHAHHEHAHG